MPIDLFAALASLAAGDAPAIELPPVLPLIMPLAARDAPLAVLGVDAELDPDIVPLGLVVVLDDVCAIAPAANKPARRMLNSLVINLFLCK